ncbi:MAG: hypothetical protein K6C40_14700 [Thermoguttaceae bacterium]|nr:hypothetical protein [Thermoguttaceae bacterium]
MNELKIILQDDVAVISDVSELEDHSIPIAESFLKRLLCRFHRSERLPTNLMHAQHYNFGAHTFKSIDEAEDQAFHAEWLQLCMQP